MALQSKIQRIATNAFKNHRLKLIHSGEYTEYEIKNPDSFAHRFSLIEIKKNVILTGDLDFCYFYTTLESLRKYVTNRDFYSWIKSVDKRFAKKEWSEEKVTEYARGQIKELKDEIARISLDNEDGDDTLLMDRMAHWEDVVINSFDSDYVRDVLCHDESLCMDYSPSIYWAWEAIVLFNRLYEETNND